MLGQSRTATTCLTFFVFLFLFFIFIFIFIFFFLFFLILILFYHYATVLSCTIPHTSPIMSPFFFMFFFFGFIMKQCHSSPILLPPAHQMCNETNNRHNTMSIYTDRAYIHNGKKNARYGGGVWFGPNDPRNIAFKVPENKLSNQIGELAAIIIVI